MENIDSIKGVLLGYAEWLRKTYHYKQGEEMIKFKPSSVPPYINYMVSAVNDLGMSAKDFEANSKPGLLKVFLNTIKGSNSFKARTKKDQSDIISAFSVYITYKETHE